MDYIQRQRGNIVLYKEQKADVEIADKYTAYIVAVSFKLSAFYDRYSPHAYIDYSRVYVRHPKPKRKYMLPEDYLELLEQKRYSPSTIKTYRAYFSDYMEHHISCKTKKIRII